MPRCRPPEKTSKVMRCPDPSSSSMSTPASSHLRLLFFRKLELVPSRRRRSIMRYVFDIFSTRVLQEGACGDFSAAVGFIYTYINRSTLGAADFFLHARATRCATTGERRAANKERPPRSAPTEMEK